MAKYVVKVGQNLFDVALSLYGSIEGVLDLFSCNPNLSFDSDLKDGDVLQYTDNYYEDSTVLDYFKTNGIVPANQIGNIYFKSKSQLKMVILIDHKLTYFHFKISGIGTINIDWGDNTSIESFDLSSTQQIISHIKKDELFEDRKICLYGDFKIYSFDLSSMPPLKIYITSPLYAESITILGANKLENIEFLNLIDHNSLIDIDLVHSKLSNLSPLINLKHVKSINLSYSNIKQSVIDHYLISLVQKYNIRRNCTVNLYGTIEPSGIYQRPENLRDPKTGMEAIWVIVNKHKESSGPWKFILTNNTYSTNG